MKKSFVYILRLFTAVVGMALATTTSSLGQINSSGETIYRNKKVFRLKAWTTITENEKRAIIYRFPDFQEGTITRQKSQAPESPLKLNLNIHKSQVVYITDKADTAAISKQRELKTVTIGDHLFYSRSPKAGFVEKTTETKVALGTQQHIVVMMESGSGERFKASDWDTPTSKYDRLFTVEDEYFFIDQQAKILKANQPSLLKLFRSSKKEVKKYIRTNKINFKVKEDLIKILEFCDTLK